MNTQVPSLWKERGVRGTCWDRGFSPLMFMRSTKVSATTKLYAEHETPPIANVLL